MKMLSISVAIIVVVLLLVGLVAARASRSAAKAPALGTPAPNFTLNAQDGKPVSLQDFRGQWVVLYFYPKDFTSGCTKEARNFQHDHLDRASAALALKRMVAWNDGQANIWYVPLNSWLDVRPRS